MRAELSDLVDVEARIGVKDRFENLVKDIAVVRRGIAESPVVAWKLVVKRAFRWELECVFDVTVVALNRNQQVVLDTADSHVGIWFQFRVSQQMTGAPASRTS